MHFAITASLLIVCGAVSAVHHYDIQGPASINRMKYKRSVFGGFPFTYGYHMPIEPMSASPADRALERAPDSLAEAYQPPAFWDPYYYPAASTQRPAADPRLDAVYRTLMQRAADADAADRGHGGNLAIQLTANLVYGYRPSDVAEPAEFPRMEASVRFGGPGRGRAPSSSSYAAEPSVPAVPGSDVFVVALQPSSGERDDDDAAAAAATGYGRPPAHRYWRRGPAYSSGAGSAGAAVTDDQALVDAFWRELFDLSGSDETATEPDRAENEIDGGGGASEPPATAATTDDGAPDRAENEIDGGGDASDPLTTTATTDDGEPDRAENEIDGGGGASEPPATAATTTTPTESDESGSDDSAEGVSVEQVVCDRNGRCGPPTTTTESWSEDECDEDGDCEPPSTTTARPAPVVHEVEIVCDENGDCDPSIASAELIARGVEVECDEDGEECSQGTTTEIGPVVVVEEIECNDDDGEECSQGTTTEATSEDDPEVDSSTATDTSVDTTTAESGYEMAEITVDPVPEDDEPQGSTATESVPRVEVTSSDDDTWMFNTVYVDDEY